MENNGNGTTGANGSTGMAPVSLRPVNSIDDLFDNGRPKGLRELDVEVPEWGRTFRLRELTMQRWESIREKQRTGKVDDQGYVEYKEQGYRARVIASSMVRGDGTAMVTNDQELDDVAAKVSALPKWLVDRLYFAAAGLMVQTQAARDDQEKNSEATQPA